MEEEGFVEEFVEEFEELRELFVVELLFVFL